MSLYSSAKALSIGLIVLAGLVSLLAIRGVLQYEDVVAKTRATVLVVFFIAFVAVVTDKMFAAETSKLYYWLKLVSLTIVVVIGFVILGAIREIIQNNDVYRSVAETIILVVVVMLAIVILDKWLNAAEKDKNDPLGE